MDAAAIKDSYEVVIIGAGPAGSTAATLLATAGRDVVVIERQRFPRFVIGESLLPRCMDLLDEAGLLGRVAGRAYMVKSGATFLTKHQVCDFNFAEQFSPGWAYTWQVPRADFDMVLADGARAAGAAIFFEQTVIAAQVGAQPSVRVRAADGSERTIACRFIVDASGYGRVLPRLLHLDAPSAQAHRKSLFAHVTGDARPRGANAGRTWIVMHGSDAWVWIIPFADGRTSVGVVAEAAFYDRFAGEPAACLAAILAAHPITAARLGEVEVVLGPKVLEGYSVGVDRFCGDGYCLVGNSTEFLDPIFSSGVTLALESANRAAKVLIRHLDGEAVAWQTEYADYMQRGIDCFRTYVDAWYDGTLATLFFTPNPEPEVIKKICSVLAGYVWDLNNPFVRDHRRKLSQLMRLIRQHG